MAKKSRRRKQPRRIGRKKTSGKEADLRQEYQYVLSDLKRITLLAGAMLALLILLSFLIK